MGTIKNLKKIIDVLCYALIGIAVSALLFLIVVYFFGDSLFSSTFSLTMKMTFLSLFNWKMFIVPLTIVVNYILFIIAIFSLRKCGSLFIQFDFYNEEVIKNLKRAGTLFVFIGVTSIIVTFYFKIIGQNMFRKEDTFFIKFIYILISALDYKSVFSITIGLFFLLFSKIFDNSRILKQENDLTI